MLNIKNKLLLLIVFIILALISGVILLHNSAVESQLNITADEISYKINPGRSFTSVINDLAKKGIISRPKVILLHGRLTGDASRMKAGNYQLKREMTVQQMLDNFYSGKVIQYSITLIEGWTFKQMLAEIKKHPMITHTLSDTDYKLIMGALGHKSEHPEGRFLPDTYQFSDNMTDIEILNRAYEAMQKTLQQEWDKRAVGLPYKTPYEALIMASIVEKETGKASERKEIAGVFIRRLEKRMRLQTDPTVIYGMGDKFKGNLRKRDLLKDTAYNTYRRRGLPPTPIALPGRAAINAALNPAEGSALYFVSKGDGSHVFSDTLEEHNNAVIKYQLKGRARSFSSYKHKESKKNNPGN